MLKYFAGAVLSNLFPAVRLQVERGFTMPYFGPESNTGIASRLIRAYVGQQTDQAKLETLHKRFWQEQRPQAWFDATSDRLHRSYIPTFEKRMEEIHCQLLANQIEGVVEFGTGNGDWLAYLKTKWTGLNHFLGVDLAESQIIANRQRHPSLEFEASDLTAWVEGNESRKTLFLTHCGVLEYLSESSLQRLFAVIQAKHPQSMVLFVEPIAADFDLASDTHSRLQGSEYSFFHNYPQLLKQAGFEILDTTEFQLEGFRMLCTLAKSNEFHSGS